MRKFTALILGLVFSFGFAVHPVTAQDLTDEKIKELALEAILENPQIIMEAVAILEQRQQQEQALAAAEVMGEISNDANAPVMGNPDGDVVVVEFFDYNCPYCRRAGAVVKDLIAADPNVKVVYREWPILGDASVVATRASLAARKQGKYDAFHWALMESEGRASEATVMRLARELGMDTDQLKIDMQSDEVTAHIAESNEMARAMGFTGTPAFVVGDQAAPGLITLDELSALIADAREG